MSESHICKPKERLICADCYNSLVEETCEQDAETAQLREQVAKLQAEVKDWSGIAEAASNDRRKALDEIAKLQATIERVRAIVFVSYSALPGIILGEIRKALSESEAS